MDMKPDTIVLFENDKEGNEKRPDLTGTALWNGEEIKISLWENTSKKVTGIYPVNYRSPTTEAVVALMSTEVPKELTYRFEN